MRVYGVQLDTVWEDKAANYERVKELLQRNSIVPGSLVALPEMFSTGFSMNVPAVVERPDGSGAAFLESLAVEYRCFVLAGMVSTGIDDRGRNDALLFDPAGRQALRYQKIHPFRYAGETTHYEAGSEVETFEWGGFTAAPVICYDLRFPELFRLAVRRGTGLFVVIANWPEVREQHWLTLLRARAIENQAWVMGVNRCGSDPNVAYSGRSQVIDPRGNVVVDAGSGEGVFFADVDPAAMEGYRRSFPVLEDIRAGFLGPGPGG